MIKRKCSHCGKVLENENPFCPDCRNLGLPVKEGPIKRIKPRKKKTYDDWNPPSPVTIYCKVMNMPYSTFRYGQGMGMAPSKLIQIENDLEEHKYSCSSCSNVFRTKTLFECLRKKRAVEEDAICRSYEPQPGIISETSRKPTKKKKDIVQ